MRKVTTRRAGGSPRKKSRASRLRRTGGDPSDGLGPVETLVMYLAAARAMEKLRVAPTAGRRPRQRDPT
jgi:hypothetical protein